MSKTVTVAIVAIIINIALVLTLAMLNTRSWNDGMCFRCKDVEWQFDRVSEDGCTTLWYCPKCYKIIEKY